MESGPLAELRVVEIGEGVAVATCGKLLADLGADVVKVEPPGGDRLRRLGPFPGNVPDPNRSATFLATNTSKRGITLDIALPTGRDLLRRLVQRADCLLESFPPGYLDGLGCGYEALSHLNPRLIMASITPFGQKGRLQRWKAHDINVLAAAAVTHGLGRPEREPLTLPAWQADKFAGLNAAVSVLIAEMARRRSGAGTHIDVAEVDCWATFMAGVGLQPFLDEGRIRMRSGHRALHQPHLDATLPCKDGYVTLDTPQRRQWERLLRAIGREDMLEDPRFARPLDMTDRWAEDVERSLEPWLMAHTREEIFQLARQAQFPAAPVYTVGEVLEVEHLRARGYWSTVPADGSSSLIYPGPPFRLSATPWRIRRPAPRLGEHNREVYVEELGLSEEELVALRQHGVI